MDRSPFLSMYENAYKFIQWWKFNFLVSGALFLGGLVLVYVEEMDMVAETSVEENKQVREESV